MMSETRQKRIGKIKSSIHSHGYHITIVQGGPDPRFAYTIGLYEKYGFEFVFAGGAFFTLDQVLSIMKEYARGIICGEMNKLSSLEVEGSGRLSIQEVDESWEKRLFLGALDYYGLTDIKAFQIIPDKGHWTIDIPNMREAWNPISHPVWNWLENTWNYPVSSKSKAITNLGALRGEPITEVARWGEDEWEMFAGSGPDVDKKELRIVPLGTMLGYDSSIESVIYLNIGSGLWREAKGEWHSWEHQGN
jgi:hypothetical protein